MGLILLIIMNLLLVGPLPNSVYTRSWGHYTSGVLGLVLLLRYLPPRF